MFRCNVVFRFSAIDLTKNYIATDYEYIQSRLNNCEKIPRSLCFLCRLFESASVHQYQLLHLLYLICFAQFQLDLLSMTRMSKHLHGQCQWRVKDFPDVEGRWKILEVGANTYYLATFLPKTA